MDEPSENDGMVESYGGEQDAGRGGELEDLEADVAMMDATLDAPGSALRAASRGASLRPDTRSALDAILASVDADGGEKLRAMIASKADDALVSALQTALSPKKSGGDASAPSFTDGSSPTGALASKSAPLKTDLRLTKKQAKKLMTICGRMCEVMKKRKELNGSFFKLFQLYDRDRSGKLDYDEVRDIVKKELKIRVTETDVGVFWKALNPDDSPNITIKEFAAFMRKYQDSVVIGAARFSKSAKDGFGIFDGCVDDDEDDALDGRKGPSPEMLEVVRGMQEKVDEVFDGSWYRLWKKYDKDGSRKLQLDELRKICKDLQIGGANAYEGDVDDAQDVRRKRGVTGDPNMQDKTKNHPSSNVQAERMKALNDVGEAYVPEAVLRELWHLVDNNNSGYITLDEWTEFISQYKNGTLADRMKTKGSEFQDQPVVTAAAQAMSHPVAAPLGVWANALGLDKKPGDPVKWYKTMSNGYLLGLILSRYFPKMIYKAQFSNSNSASAKRDNWKQMSEFLKKNKVKLSATDVECVCDYSDVTEASNAVLRLVAKTYQFLAKYGHAPPLSSHLERGFSLSAWEDEHHAIDSQTRKDVPIIKHLARPRPKVQPAAAVSRIIQRAMDLTESRAKRAGIPKERLLDVQDRMRAAIYKLGLGVDHFGGGRGLTLYDIFNLHDLDQSGELGLKEFRKAMRYGMKVQPELIGEEELCAIFKAIDYDSGGYIRAEEFVDFVQVTPSVMILFQQRMHMASLSVGSGEGNWADVLRRSDRDGSGELSYEEFLKMVRTQLRLPSQNLPDQDVTIIFKIIDSDGTGHASIEELVEFISNGNYGESDANGDDAGGGGGLPAVKGAEPRNQTSEKGYARGTFFNYRSEENEVKKRNARKAKLAAARQQESSRADPSGVVMDTKEGGVGILEALSAKLQEKANRAGVELKLLAEMQNKLRRDVYNNGIGVDTFGGGRGTTLRDVFLQHDKDKSGEISFKEFQKVIRQDMKITWDTINDDEMWSIARAIDDSGDENVSIDEFCEFLQITPAVLKMVRDRLKASLYKLGGEDWEYVFKKYDKDKSGSIGYDEFRLIVRKELKMSHAVFPDVDAKAVFGKIDQMGDGDCSIAELVAFIRGHELAGAGSLKKTASLKKQRSVKRGPSEADVRAKANIEAAQSAAKQGSALLKSTLETMIKRANKCGLELMYLVELQTRFRTEVYKIGIGKDMFGGDRGTSLKDMWLQWDQDHSGEMSCKELRKVIRYDMGIQSTQIPDVEIEAVFDAVDMDNSGNVTVDEFCGFIQITPKMLKTLQSKIKAAAYTTGGKDWSELFRRQDKDHSGELTWEEWRVMCRKVVKLNPADFPDTDLRAVFEALDEDGGGTVGIVELIAFVASDDGGLVQSHEAEFGKQPAPPSGEKPKQTSAYFRNGRAEKKSTDAMNKALGRTKSTDHIKHRPKLGKGLNKRAHVMADQEEILDMQLAKTGLDERVLIGVQEKIRAHVYKMGIGAASSHDKWTQKPSVSIRGIFEAQWDTNGDGTLTLPEFRKLLRMDIGIKPAKLPDSELQSVFACIDMDDTGHVDLDEFVEFVQITPAMLRGLQKAFREKATAGGKTVEQFFAAMDRMNGDAFAGKLEWDEYYRMCRKTIGLEEKRYPEIDLKSIFECLDRDDSASISLAELVEFIVWEKPAPAPPPGPPQADDG